MIHQWVMLAVLCGFAWFGSYTLARLLRGRRLFGAMVLWLMAPFLLIMLLIVSQMDPTLTSQQQSYNAAFGFVLISGIVAVPWFTVTLVGVLMGRRARQTDRDDDSAGLP